MGAPEPRPGILDIAPYVPGSSRAAGGAKTYKLSSNESALGPSPKARAAFEAAGGDLHLYPDGSATALREAIAQKHGLNPAQIVCGAGSDELLQLLTRAYTGPENNIVQSDHGFLVYALAAKSCGAEVRFAPEKNLTCDVDAMAALADDQTTLCFIANPNNPTGTYVPETDLRRLREKLPKHVILVVDSAYAEYMEEPDYADGAAMVDAFDNVVMTRTFSKIYGLGGLRLGWGYFPQAIADVMHRVRGPFNVSAAAIEAGVAAIGDDDFVVRNIAHNRQERARVARRLGGLGLECVPSFGNFILVRFPERQGEDAGAILQYLSERGVIVRGVGAYKLPDFLRISIGAREANDAMLAALESKFG